MNKSSRCHTYKLSSRWIGVLFAVFSCIDVNLLFFFILVSERSKLNSLLQGHY